MKILACDTSGQSCGCALIVDGQTVSSSFLSNGTTHSQTFMPMLDEMMKRSQYDYHELDAFACVVGPGSFTGIRIGVSAVKAMAYATQKPAIPVSSLHALAKPLLYQKDVFIVPMIDARNNRVFAAAYYNGEQIISEKAQDIQAFILECDQWRNQHAPNALILTCGNAGHRYDDPDSEDDRLDVRNASSVVQIDPASVGHIAFEKCIEAKYGSDLKQINDLMKVLLVDEKNTFSTKEKMNDSLNNDLLSIYSPEALMPSYLAKTAAERNKRRTSEHDSSS